MVYTISRRHNGGRGCHYQWRIEAQGTIDPKMDYRLCLRGTEGSSQCRGLRSSCTGWTRRPVRPGPVASEMTPTTGAANVVTAGRSSHVLLSSTSPFRCFLYALGRLRAALSSRESVKAGGDRALQARLATVVSIITERHWFLDCTSMIAAIFSSVQEIAHVTEIIQETCSFTPE